MLPPVLVTPAIRLRVGAAAKLALLLGLVMLRVVAPRVGEAANRVSDSEKPIRRQGFIIILYECN